MLTLQYWREFKPRIFADQSSLRQHLRGPKDFAAKLAIAFTIALLACSSTFPQDPNASVKIEIARANPDTSNVFTITVSGIWRDSCVPQNPTPARFGQSIYINTSTPGQCNSVSTPFSFAVTVGPLPVGTFEVVVLYSSPRHFNEVIGTSQLTVSFGLEVIPSDPGTSDDVSLKISGVWPDSCVPRNAKVTLSRELIRIDTSNPSQGCLDVVSPYSLTVFVGKLAARDYAVLVTYSGASRPSSQINPVTLGRSSFTVRSHEAQVEAHPSNPSSRDNVYVTIVGEGSPCSPHDPKVTISSGMIRIDTSYFAGPCILFLMRWGLVVPIGKLDAGPYQVVVTKSPEGGGPQQIIARSNLMVTAPATREKQFSHFATGAGISTSIILTNPSQTETATGTVVFAVDDQKGPVPISVNGAPPTSFVPFTIKPLNTATFNTDGSANLISGAARVFSDIPIGGVLKLFVPGLGVAEINAEAPARGWVVPVRASLAKNLTTAIAVAGPGDVVFTLRDRNGDIVPGGQMSYSLSPTGHFARFLHGAPI